MSDHTTGQQGADPVLQGGQGLGGNVCCRSRQAVLQTSSRHRIQIEAGVAFGATQTGQGGGEREFATRLHCELLGEAGKLSIQVVESLVIDRLGERRGPDWRHSVPPRDSGKSTWPRSRRSAGDGRSEKIP